MHNPEQSAEPVHVPLAQRWRRVSAAYRVCNLATHHVLGFTLKLALLVYFLFAIIFLFLRYAVLPNIDYYKGDIEKLASRAIGNQVAITRIYASWKGLSPNLFLGDVILRDKQGRQVLTLPSVSATLSWWSVVAAEPRFHSLEIIRPDLDVRRDARGRLMVAGIVLDTAPTADGKGADWVFRQREVIVREGKIRWTDELRGAPELDLDQVGLLLRNRWDHHRIAVRATPPATLSGPVDLRADFTHPRFAARVSDMAQWRGELFADVRNTDLAAWKPYLDYPFEISQGKGSVRAWIGLNHAKLVSFTADLGLAGVAARLGRDLPPLALASVRGRISASETFPDGANRGELAFGARGHTLALTDFALTTADGLALAPTSAAEAYAPASAGMPEQFHVSARQLDLATLARLAGQLPLAPSLRAMLADYAPRGVLSDFSANWSGRYPAIGSYRIRGKLAGLSIRPQAHIPGFDKLSGSIDAHEKGGVLALDSHGLVLQMPAWFADPAMPFDQLAMKARWSFLGKDQLQLQLESLNLTQGKLRATLTGKHQVALGGQARGPGTTDLHGTFSGFAVNEIGRFLPLQTPPELHAWLTGALEAGTVHDASVRLRGDLAQFPFKGESAQERARGEFRIAGRIENGRLNYSPGHLSADGKGPLWPQADAINGSFAFDRARMEIRGETARTAGVALAGVKAVIADLSVHDKLLEIEGTANGAMQEFLRYVILSPVNGWIGHFTEPTRASGNAKLHLKLQLPLARLRESKVQGVLSLMSNDVVLFPELPPIQAAIGKLEFNEHGINLNGVGASFLGGPLALTGGTQRDNTVLIRMAGAITAEGIRKQYAAPAMAPITGRVNGAARYAGTITVREGQAQVTVDSTLAGLGLDFPAPLAKAAADALPLHFTSSTLPATAEPGVQRDDIRISLGSSIAARYLRQKLPGGSWKVLSGGAGVNLPAPEVEEGMMINVNLKTLNVDQWVQIGKSITGAQAAGPAAPDNDGAYLAQYIVPDVMAARATELIIGERKLDNVVVGASHQQQTWQASIDSKQASGHVTWDEGAGGHGLGKVTARLASLIIPESSAADVKDLLDGGKSVAATIPALDIVADQFELFDKQLGRLDLVANNSTTAAGREWRINRLMLSNTDGTLRSSGKYVTREGVSTTSINFVLDIDDAGKLLDRFGFPETLRRGKGRLSGDIAWNGVPYSLDIPTLSGKIDLNVASGQFLKQDPGAAKLLGVLSLQMLPRILKLDFHDVFSEGLAFDGITASALITRGVARTDNLRMHGVAATVLMDGTADIANESTNLHVVVIPEFNLGTGPLVYALAVNPVIGLGSFLAQLFLRAPMMRALTYEMQVTGPWKAPVITKLAGARAQAALDAEATKAKTP